MSFPLAVVALTESRPPMADASKHSSSFDSAENSAPLPAQQARHGRVHGVGDWRMSESFRARKTSGSSVSEFGSGILFGNKPSTTGRELSHGTLLEIKNAGFVFHGKEDVQVLQGINLKIDVGECIRAYATVAMPAKLHITSGLIFD